DVARRSSRGVSKWSLCYQTAGVDRPKRHTSTDGGVDRGVELRLVVHAIQPQAAGEIDERFLLAKLPQHFGSRLQRGQLTIGIENVELTVVLPECGSRIRSTGVVGGFVRSLALSHNQRFDDAQQPVAIIGE